MQLRDYQNEALVAIWNEILAKQTALCVLSTGAGKSVIIHELLRKAISSKPDIKCLVLFNRVTLLSQLAERFSSALGASNVGVYCGTEGRWELDKSVTVGSIQSLDPGHLNFNLIIIDECHNLNESDGRYISFLRHQMQTNPKTKVVGFTATPFRHDGFIYGKGKIFSHPCYERGLRFFIDRRHLVPPIAKQPDFQIDLSKLRVLRGEYRQEDIDAQTLNVGMARDQTIDALNRSHGRKKIVWFCSSINHAELIRNLLTEFGEIAVTLHSKMSWDERDYAQEKFEKRDARHLTFVSVVSEGYDYPPIDCIVLMRPTKSPGLMVQTCGRGLRTFAGKEDCLILDYANVISSLGPLEDPVVGKKGKGKGDQAPTQKTCPQCRTYVAPRVMACPQCGFNWPKAEATKLNLTADENVNFLSKSQQTLEISGVRLRIHISKSGNECFRLEYIPKGFFVDSISEYFAHQTEWGWRKFVIRAIELGIKIGSTPAETASSPILRVPKAIDYVMENKYAKVKRLIFSEEGHERLKI